MRNIPAFLKANWKKVAIIAGILIGALLLYFFVIAPSQVVQEETFVVKEGNLKEELTIPGEVDATEHAVVKFQAGGQLAWVGVKEGDMVKKYQGVASLDQRSVQKNLQKSLAAYKQDRNSQEQAKDDYEDGGVTDAEKRLLENAQADLDSAVLDVELQDIALKYANIWSPVDGLVVRVDSPHTGVNISPNEAEFEIINPQTIFFKGTADQTEVSKLKVGKIATLVLDAFPDEDFKGSIEKVAFIPTVNDSGTNYEVEIKFAKDNSDYMYKMGMTGDATFTTAEKTNVLYVPIKFVKSEGGKKYVTLKKNGKNEKVFVETGLETDNDIEVKTGLKKGDTIVDAKQ